MSRRTVTTRSRLGASAETMWDEAIDYEGINYELMPLMRMTAPRSVRELGLGDVSTGERICRSWVLLFGFLPFEYDDITLERIDPGRGFLEHSRMLSQKTWIHERTIEARADGCELTDRIEFEPRGIIPAALVRPIVAFAFRHRHRRLLKKHGGSYVGQQPE